MTDQSFEPPVPSPQKDSKETVTFNKKNLAIAFLALSLFILLIVILIPGNKSSAPSVTNAPAPVVTNPPVTSPPENRYDQYMAHVLNNSGQANTWSKAKIIEFGDLVCQALDNGNSIRSVVSLLNNYANTTSDAELFASVMFGSITYLCPEYESDLQVYLGN